MGKIKPSKITRTAILISLALSLHILESYIPAPVPIPGVKLGLANIITLYGIYFLGFKDTIIIVILRSFLGSLFAGSLGSLIFSLTGGLLSGALMFILYKYGKDVISIQSISVVGGIAHNAGQLLAAAIIMENFRIFSYMPILTVSGIIMGLFIGTISFYSFNRVYISC